MYIERGKQNIKWMYHNTVRLVLNNILSREKDYIDGYTYNGLLAPILI